MCALLDPNYVSQIGAGQLQSLIDQGIISKNEKGEYIGKEQYFSESCFVKKPVAAEGAGVASSVNSNAPVSQAKGVEKPVVGTVVEPNPNNKPQDKNIVSQTSTTTIAFNDITSGLTDAGYKLDEKSVAELSAELEKAGISVDKEGNISIASQEAGQKLNNIIAKYAEGKQETQLQFTKETDPEFIEIMVKEGSIKKNEDGTYTVLDKAKAEARLNKVEQEPQKQSMPPVELNIEAKKTTETVREEGAVKVADDLKHNKAGRKQTEEAFKAELEKWADKPENQSTMLLSIAKHKYSKDIDKQIGKITKEYNNKKSDVELFRDYMTNYATDDEKAYATTLLRNVDKNASDEELLAALQKGTKSNKVKDLSDPRDRKNAVYYYTLQGTNFDKNVLIERMATVDVLSKRSDKQIEKDKKEFIEDEAKRQTKAAETKQNIENTRVHFSKDARKAAEKAETNSAIEHNDIGKAGRELVMADPDRFCTEGTASDCDFEVDGKYYKFSEDKFKEFCRQACSGSLDKLDDDVRDNFDEDNNLTLQEGRDVLKEQFLRDKDGNPRSIEQILGNANGKVGNKELNELRHLIEKGGYSLDKNPTNAKRALHVLKGVGIGAALGLATAGLGSVLSGAVSIAGETASQMVTLNGPASLNYSKDVTLTGEASLAYKDWVTTTDTWTDEFGTVSSTHNTPVSGVTTGDVTLSGTVSGTATGDVSLSGEVDGQKYSDKGNNHLKTATNAAIFGGIGGGVNNAINMGKIHARSKSDLIVKLRNEITDTDTEDTTFKLNIPQSKTVSVRSGEITEKSEVPTRPFTPYRSAEAYTVLYELNGNEIPAKYREAVYRKLDQMWRAGTNMKWGDIPRNVPVYHKVTINVDGQEITVTRKDNWRDIEIAKGRPGGSGGIYNKSESESVSYRGKGEYTEYNK